MNELAKYSYVIRELFDKNKTFCGWSCQLYNHAEKLGKPVIAKTQSDLIRWLELYVGSYYNPTIKQEAS